MELLLVEGLCCGHQWRGFLFMADQLLFSQIYCVITVCTQLVSTSHVFVIHCFRTVTILEFKKAFGLNSHLGYWQYLLGFQPLDFIFCIVHH